MATPINIEQMNSLIDQTYNQKSGAANSITPVIEGNFLKDFLAFQNSYFVGKSDTIAPDKGGTGIAGGYAAGDIIIATATNVLSRLPKGSNGQVLTLVDGLPAWSAAAGGGSALSGIAAATAAHTINNAAFQQEWKWDSLGSGIGLKISTASSVATANTQVLVELRKIGGAAGAGNGSIVLNVINEDYAPSSVAKAAHFEARAFAATFGKTSIGAGYGNIGIFGNSRISFYQNNVESAYLVMRETIDYFEMGASTAGFIFKVGTTNQVRFTTSTGVPFLGYYHNGSSKQTQLFNAISDGKVYPSGTHASLFENENGVFKFSANSGLTAGNSFTPNWQLALHGANNNVGIGTLTPNASAKLDVSSTTQGFAPPEMTATQASAISTTSRKLIIYVTDTNGTFTSAGLWLWTGSIWKLILSA